MKLFDVYPLNNIAITSAKGSYVWDAEGVQYLDMYGGHAVISIGHSHPHWVKRIEEQLEKIAFYSNSIKIPLQAELAKKMGTISGKEDYNLLFLPFNDEGALEDCFRENGKEISSVIIEGIQGVGGINVADDSFM